MPLRLIANPRKREICETEMRYDLMLGDQLVAEAYFNGIGYCVDTTPGHLRGFITGEQSLASLRREVAHWNRTYSQTCSSVARSSATP